MRNLWYLLIGKMPAVGSRWRRDAGSPWDSDLVEVTDTRPGWVRYRYVGTRYAPLEFAWPVRDFRLLYDEIP